MVYCVCARDNQTKKMPFPIPKPEPTGTDPMSLCAFYKSLTYKQRIYSVWQFYYILLYFIWFDSHS